MVIRARENLIGARAFLLGIVVSIAVAILTALIPTFKLEPWILGVLAILGIIVGYFVAEKDVQTFLLASVSLVIVCYMGIQGLLLSAGLSGVNIGEIISYLMQTLLALLIPATIIVAIKTVFSISRS